MGHAASPHSGEANSLANAATCRLRVNLCPFYGGTPDRIVLGEVRGPEALELVRAMNTGHDGTLCTLHSNGAGEALRRLHTLVAEAQPGCPFGGVVSAVDHVLQLEERGQGRRLADIWPVPRDGSGEEHGR